MPLLLLALWLFVGSAHAAPDGTTSVPGRYAQAEGTQADPASEPPEVEEPSPSTPADQSSPAAEGGPEAGNPVRNASGLPEVYYGDTLLPESVRRTRQEILEAAATGDIEKLRPLLEANTAESVVSLGEGQTDPVEFLRSQSTDPEGREVLAILTDILNAGYVRVDAGTPQETFVWPYFAHYPLDRLTGPQMVEMFQIMTGKDFADMKEYGAYVFYRVGISPDGTWRFFISGD